MRMQSNQLVGMIVCNALHHLQYSYKKLEVTFMPIEIQHLHFGFDTMDRPLFEDVNLSIDTKWCLGLVGRNGRGKSTFLHLLLNNYTYTGDIRSDVEFVYFPQTIVNKESLVYYAIDEVMPIELWKFERECQLLGLNKEIAWQPFEQLSGGEQTKVLLAALFCEESRYPLLDEPTNHLDIQARKIVANYLKKKKGFIVVSHDRDFIDSVIDHILVIEKSQLAVYKGNYSTYEQQKQLQDQFELEKNKALKSEIDRLQKTAREKSGWGEKREKPSGNDPFGNAIAKRMMKRAKAIEKRTEDKIDEKTKLLQNIESVSDLTINSLSSHRNPVLRVQNFTLSYLDKPLFQPVTFDIFQGEQVALVGPNGSGKTSLINYLLNSHFSGTMSGDITVPHGLSKSIIRQQYDDNMGILKDFAANYHMDYTLFLNNLRILGVERDVFTVPIEKMSNGQKKKVEFAKSLGIPAELYIWDEPLNYLDVFNQAQIETMIKEYKPTLLFVEHDQTFLSNIATKTVEIIPY
nr:ABC-F type ribosomal protection protein [Lysinibacillus odysseyi]